MNSKPTITADNITHSFSSGKQVQRVINSVSVTLYPGQLTLIIGPSGSGKSTLLAILAGLLKPDSGQVIALNQTISDMTRSQRERFRLQYCGFVFQSFNLFNALTAKENVLLALNYAKKMKKREASLLAEQALETVGLANRIHLRPMELSGGEKQRVSIARSIVTHPEVLFADEPTSSLDKHNGQIVIDLLHQFVRQHNATVIAVSHDSRLIDHADRIITLEDGQITADTYLTAKES